MVETKYVKDVAVAELTGRGLSTLRTDRSKGRGIRYVKIGGAVLYDIEDVHDFMAKHKIEIRNKN